MATWLQELEKRGLGPWKRMSSTVGDTQKGAFPSKSFHESWDLSQRFSVQFRG
jgi:hypothetical protein